MTGLQDDVSLIFYKVGCVSLLWSKNERPVSFIFKTTFPSIHRVIATSRFRVQPLNSQNTVVVADDGCLIQKKINRE